MDKNKIIVDLQEILVEEFGYNASGSKGLDVNDDISELGLDSFQFVELAYEAERKFNIKIDNSDLATINKISDFVSLIKRRVEHE